MQRIKTTLAPLLLLLGLLLSGCALQLQQASVSLDEVPAYSGAPYVEIDGNQPAFTEADYTTESFEEYAPLDRLGRCGTAYACISTDLMPTERARLDRTGQALGLADGQIRLYRRQISV